MILSFKERFEQPILNGTKIHSMRDDFPNRWRKGKKIHFAKGVRTKKYFCFKIGHCHSTQKVEIQEIPFSLSGPTIFGFCFVCIDKISHINSTDFQKKIFRVKIDGRILSTDEIIALSRNDGFEDPNDFFLWFNETCSKKLIHWTPFKY